MAHSASPGVPTPDTDHHADYRFSGFSYQNWSMDGEPPLIVNKNASLHHKLAWLWGEVSILSDAVHEICCDDDKHLRIFANFITSRLMPMEAMLDHLGDITSRETSK